MVEKIEIKAKEIFTIYDDLGVSTTPYHAYVVYTNNQGNQYILRGGYAESSTYGSLQVVGADSLVSYSRDNNTIHRDWDFNSSNPNLSHKTLKTITGSDLSQEFNLMRIKGSQIDNMNLDYEVGAGRNSNYTIDEVLKYAGFGGLFENIDAGSLPSNATLPFGNSGGLYSAKDTFFEMLFGSPTVQNHSPKVCNYTAALGGDVKVVN